MPLFSLTLAKEDFDRIPWQDVILEASRKECHTYSSGFLRKLQEAKQSGDATAIEVYTVLLVIADLGLDAEDTNEPFGPSFSMRTARSPGPNDLQDQHFQVLADIAPGVADPEMKARLADLLWVM